MNVGADVRNALGQNTVPLYLLACGGLGSRTSELTAREKTPPVAGRRASKARSCYTISDLATEQARNHLETSPRGV